MASSLPPFFSQDQHEIARLVSIVDPSLQYDRDMNPSGSSCRTLLVRQEQVPRVLKIHRHSTNLWDDTYFNLEVLALKRAAERQVPHVAHMTRHYHSEDYEALLKEFIPGIPGNEIDPDTLFYDWTFISQLDQIYMNLHLAGIAKVSFLPRKVVIGEDNDVTLVDLSSCVVNTEHGLGRFVQEMHQDARFISRLERQVARV
ncbi:MAG TPA: hypothetical protein VJ998_03055 [Pseudomonadales bacterium]|nr:hypothetical protein [Pseudomonadales bacterium]